MNISDEEFDAIITGALKELPDKFTDKLDNVAIVYADEPTPQQRAKLKLRCNESLFGLYEGIPLPARNSAYTFVLPDKITLFKHPMLFACRDLAEFKAQVKHTLWHEIAHHFGLDHARIHELEQEKA